MDRPGLRCGKLAVELAPETGGSIARFDWVEGGERIPILRGTDDGQATVLDMGSFPLVPYVNRIRGGRFNFRGREVRIAPNMADDVSPLHGQGWLNPWSVETTTDRTARLRFEHPIGEWPWRYEAVQHFELDDAGLSLSLECRNLADDPMPCGLGQHPYFHCSSETRLETRVTHAWTIDEHVLPVERVGAEGRFDLADRLVCGQGLDHGFGGWGGRAGLTDPGWPFSVEMSSPSARFFQLYSPAAGGICVIEPVTHANAALNAPEEEWDELGMTILRPGEEMRLDMRLDVRPG